MRQPAYVELCDIERIDFVQMIVNVKTEYGMQLNFPIIYSGTVSDAVDYGKLKALVLYTDYMNETGIAFIVPKGLFNQAIAEKNSKKPKFVTV